MEMLNRTALLADDGANKDTSRNMKINIEITSVLPLLSMSQVTGVGPTTADTDVVSSIHYNRAVGNTQNSPAPTPADFKNSLVDPDDGDRFVPMAIIKSMSQHTQAHLYYDGKYKDMILVPDLRSFGDSEKSLDMLKSYGTLNIMGYLVGHQISSGELLVPMLNGESILPANLPTPSGQIETATHRIITYNPKLPALNNNFGVMYGDEYLESNNTPMANFVSLGSTANVFGAEISLYRATDIALNETRYIKTSPTHADDILVYMPF